MANETKFFKNPERKNKVEHTKYVPQYKVMGITPTPAPTRSDSGFQELKKQLKVNIPDLPRTGSRPSPYAEIASSRSQEERSSIPNVGNNAEHTWSASNHSQLVDDLGDDYLEVNSTDMFPGDVSGSAYYDDENVSTGEGFESPEQELSSLAVGSLSLFVKEIFITSGSLEYIQEQTSLLIYGDHELCDNGEPFDVKDIVVFKKMDIRVGIFLEG